MPIVYDAVNNVMTVTGYTEAVPCTFSDLWNADKAGSRQLLAPTAAAVDLSLTTQPKPTDDKALKLNLIITAFSVAGTVTLTGKDKDNVAQTEDISITATGTYVSAKWWLSIDVGGIDCTGTYTIEVSQSRWGVVWKSEPNQFRVDAKFTIGDYSVASWFASEDEQVTFGDIGIAYLEILIYVNGYGHFRLGRLDDEATKRTSHGTELLDNSGAGGHRLIYAYLASDVGIFNSQLSTKTGGYIYPRDTSTMKVYQSLLNNIMFESGTSTLYVFYTTMSGQGLTYGLYQPIKENYEELTVQGYLIGLALWVGQGVKNAKFKANTYLVYPRDYGSGDSYLINVEADNWNFYSWYSATHRILRQYEFDLAVTDKDGMAINGATVTLKDKDGNTVFSTTTDANGLIATQTVSRGYYAQATGNTLQEYSPHTLTITKNGYQTYVKKFILSAKTVWEIKLAKAVGVFLSFGQPVINLKGAEPENKDVMVL